MPLYLVPTEREDGPVPFDKPILFFGRHVDCDVIITCSRRVSRRHCCVAQVGDGLLVRDLGSMNGIRVNGTRVRVQSPLKMGDVLSVGDVKFQLKEGRYDVPKGKVTIGPPLEEAGDQVAQRGKPVETGPRSARPRGEAARKFVEDRPQSARKPRPVQEFANPDSEDLFLKDAAAAAPERGSLDILPPEKPAEVPESIPVAEPAEPPKPDAPAPAAPPPAADPDPPLPKPASSDEILELGDFDLLD